jgi:hypothetical protein
MKLIQTEEEKFLRSKYRSMESRVRNNSYYSTIENEYENERDFIEYWIGKVDYKSNPELDRIDKHYGYSKLNNQWLSKADHKIKSSKERAKLSDKQAREVLESDESTWKIADRFGDISQHLIYRLKSGKSYSWVLR